MGFLVQVPLWTPMHISVSFVLSCVGTGRSPIQGSLSNESHGFGTNRVSEEAPGCETWRFKKYGKQNETKRNSACSKNSTLLSSNTDFLKGRRNRAPPNRVIGNQLVAKHNEPEKRLLTK